MKKILKCFDMFGVNQFTRFKAQQTYTTATGGVCSLLVIGILLSIFIFKAIELFSLTNIITTSEIIYETSPRNYKTNISSTNNFLFAFGLTGGKDFLVEYLSFKLWTTEFYQNSSTGWYDNKSYPLKPCDINNWSGINDEITLKFRQRNIDYFLCPPQNFTLQLQGKRFQNIFKYATITIQSCPVANGCYYRTLSNTVYNGVLPTVNFFWINSLINKNKKEPVTYYIEQISQIRFDKYSTTQANIQFLEYEIKTDESLFPWSQTTTKTGIYTNQIASMQTYTRQRYFVIINLVKSSNRNQISRSFLKITDVFSYVGGLLSPLLLLFSFVYLYNTLCYQIQFGDKIFKSSKNGQSFDSNSFNLLTYLKYLLYLLASKFGDCKNWKSICKYYNCRMEAIKQLDIHLLFRKIQLLEEACNTMLQEHHLIGLHLLSKKTLKDSKKWRKRYIMQDLVFNELDTLNRLATLKDHQFQKEHQKYLESETLKIQGGNFITATKEVLELKKEFSEYYRKLNEQSSKGDSLSKKLVQRLNPTKRAKEDEISIPLSGDDNQQNPENNNKDNKQQNAKIQVLETMENMQNICTNTELVRASSIQTL